MDDARVYKAFEENGIYAGVNSMKELKKKGTSCTFLAITVMRQISGR